MAKLIASIFMLSLVSIIFAQSEDLFCWDQSTCCDGHPAAHSLGDWHNCSIYFLCFGTPTAYSCPGDDDYNPENGRCVPTGEVDGCEGGTRAPSATSEPPTSSVTGDPPTSTAPPENGNCTEDGAYYIPYPGDCTMYLICSNHVVMPLPGKCAPGTLFDPTIGECNLEELVDCIPQCPNDDGVAYLPHDKNCSQYWLCTLGTPTLKTCPVGLVFDPKLESCNQEDQVFCPNMCPKDVPTVNLPHSNDCTKYWLCIYGDPTLKQCPEGLHFDPLLGQCSPQEGECQENNFNENRSFNDHSSESSEEFVGDDYFNLDNDYLK